MAIISYITATEANNFFTQDTDYTAQQRSDALNTSFSMVNSYISKSVTIPQVATWNGEGALNAPGILKISQCEFYKYLLMVANDGDSDELHNQFLHTVEKLKGIQDGDLSVGTQIYAHQTGWHVNEINISGMAGDVYVQGAAPIIKQNYKLVITTGGYPTSIRYSVFRDDSATARATSMAGTYESWTTVDSAFEIMWAGQWTVNDVVYIQGIPESAINSATTSGPVIRQGAVAYGSPFPRRGV